MALVVFPLSSIASDEPGQNSTKSSKVHGGKLFCVALLAS